MRIGSQIKLILIAIFLAQACATRSEEAVRLAISYPPRGIETRFQQIRIAGSCDPSCSVRVNGKPVRVYHTGAFVDLVRLEKGENEIKVCAEKAGVKERINRKVRCTHPLVTSPVSPPVIDSQMMEPAADMVLQPGDELRVRVKGSPGAKAFWSLGNIVVDAPMKEAEPAGDGALKGVAGIYEASYRVREGKGVRGERARFRLVSGEGESAGAFSPGKVTLLPLERITKGVVREKGARLREETGGDMLWKLLPGTCVNLCGEAGDHYRVRLSESERYWVRKKSVEPLKGKGPCKVVLVGLPVVTRFNDCARILLPLQGRPPVRVRQSVRDGELTLDIFGAESAEKRKRVKGVSPVKWVEIEGDDDGPLRVIASVRGGQQWGYRCGFAEGGLVLEVKNRHGKTMEGTTIVVDPGHGGAQPGAVSITGVPEKDFNLVICKELADYLRGKGARVVLTMEKDTTLSLGDRVAISGKEGADIFVSVHNNSRPGRCDPLSRRGSDVFYAVPQSKKLAESILNRLKKTGLKANGCPMRNFAVILPTEYPAVLVECAYMSHPEDEAKLLREGFLRDLGRAIGKGIVDFVSKSG